MSTTGESCQVSGIYRVVNHIQHPKQVTMVKGDRFPPCSQCNTKVTYELVTKTQH